MVIMQPPMSKTRLDMIDKAFCKMDRTGDGEITVEDLKLYYNVSQHPKFLSGEKTADELLKKFLDVFPVSYTHLTLPTIYSV